MKKLFIILIIFLGIVSCSVPLEPIENSKSITTIEILDNIDTLYQVSIVEDKVYLLQDNEVVYILQSHVDNNDGVTLINIWYVFITTVLSIGVFFIGLSSIFDN